MHSVAGAGAGANAVANPTAGEAEVLDVAACPLAGWQEGLAGEDEKSPREEEGRHRRYAGLPRRRGRPGVQ